jgi:hypothetical protein
MPKQSMRGTFREQIAIENITEILAKTKRLFCCFAASKVRGRKKNLTSACSNSIKIVEKSVAVLTRQADQDAARKSTSQ